MCKTKWPMRFITVCLSLTTLLSAAEQEEDAPEFKSLTLVPATEPAQALKYRLLPELIDQVNGNAALFYYGAAELCPDIDKEDLGVNLQHWLGLEVEELPREEVERALAAFKLSFHQVRLASLRKTCEWEMPIEEGYAMQIPGLSTYRTITRALALRLRLQISDGHIEEALHSLQQGLAMARGIAQGQTLIQDLVAIAISTVMLAEAEALAEAPDAPNLYWALTALPAPLIDTRIAVDYERSAIFLSSPALRRLDLEIMTTSEAGALVTKFFDEARSLGVVERTPWEGLLPHAWVMLHYTDAKQYLTRHGFAADRIEAMPAAQAVMLYQTHEHLAFQDSIGRWFYFPHYVAHPRLEEAERRIDKATRLRGHKGNLLTAVLLPALSRVSLMQARHQRQIALLRTIEALRMHVAEHQGQLPASLTEVQSVPIPLDPVTGKEFLYDRHDPHNARLEAPYAPGETKRRPVYDLALKR